MRINREWLKSLNPCTDGYEWWCRTYEEETTLEEFVKAAEEEWNYVRWLAVRCLTHMSKVQFTAYCARRVLHLYTGVSDAPRLAIEAAEKWTSDPTEANAKAAKAAAKAAHTAANAAAYAAYAVSADAANAATAYYAADYAAASASYTDFRRDAMAHLLTLETIETT